MVCEATAGLSPDRQRCFAPYSASRVMRRVDRRPLDLLRLTSPQSLVLPVLWSGEGLTMCGIDEQLQLDSATLTLLLKRPAAAGPIDRTRSIGREAGAGDADHGR